MRRINVLATLLLIATASFTPACSAQAASTSWQSKLKQQLPLLGHRNWILIVDSAYPLQVSPGIETIETGTDQLAVTSAVLNAIDHSIHVAPDVYLDAELPFVPSQNFAKINSYREDLKKTLHGRSIQSLPHEQILGMISEAGKTYKVLVLKTNMAMPYTSVFLRLDCKYWGDKDEQTLRQAMKAGSSKR
ncbi:RbsD/FucU domain-containing protein [Edaphobacter albus]|uniref:RbsD/FucU domain-containing protein n=1 Tax=Edaphobacter sp. 4G125 TaxID=2763071 RepID=UPI0016478949|nr:RbsD/FucU domain-containing protein [Edaphobacter sp. 4G125]QNI38057.1 hypothetical protein H7846_07330 [Edaphobacter sp. 4G125]